MNTFRVIDTVTMCV